HAPVALTGDTPIGTTGDHAVQTGLAPGWNELGLLDGIQRAGTQGAAAFRDLVHADDPLGDDPVHQRAPVAPAVQVAVLDAAVFGDLVHADEPLGGGPVDQRGLVAPAVHVAVLDGFVLEQRADFVELGDDVRVGLPDELAAEERQVADVDAVALYRVENVVVLHAVRLAGTEVVLTIGRRGVNDTGTGAGLHIVGQVDRREALVEGVAEADVLQRPPLATGDDGALQA